MYITKQGQKQTFNNKVKEQQTMNQKNPRLRTSSIGDIDRWISHCSNWS